MNKKILFFTLFFLLTVFVFVLTGCNNTPNHEYEYTGEYKEVNGNTYKVSPADDFSDGTGIIAWWDNWVKYSEGSVKDITKVNADAASTGSRNDEGRGPYARQIDSLSGTVAMDLLHNAGLRAGAWIETQGQTRSFMMALHQNEDGTFEIDPKTGAPKLYAWIWGWKSNGPQSNTDANYICWCGVQSFVNDEEWAYPYVLSNYPEIDSPTYPDGTSAIGYLEGGDRLTPHLAKIYDACAGKDLNGNWVRYDECALTSENEYALTISNSAGKKYVIDDLWINKDTAAPFWIQYARNSLEFWISEGVDYFWCDNWNCWDTIGNFPLDKAFGDWSVYKFKEYLKNHPEVGVTDPDSFDIKDYIKKKAKEMDPDCIPTYWSGYSVWSSKEWTKDKIWMAYLAFKVESDKAYNSALHDAKEELALKYKGDKDAVALEGNDFPYMTLGCFDCDKIDIISTEYSAWYSAATGFNTTGFPPNRYSGHAYSLLSASSRSHNAVVWYYATQYPYTYTNGLLFGYEALAYNCLLHSSFSGTKKSNTKVNETINTLKETFSDRKLYSEIGLVYSPDSEASELCPGGFCSGEQNTHDISYMGWGQAFDELNIPYKSIQMQRLASTIDSCSIIVLPNVRSISQDVIDNVLLPWVNKGGVLVITGKEAGICDSQANLYSPRSSAALVELTKKNYKNGMIIYMEEDPCFKYFIANKNSSYDTVADLYLNSFKEMIEEWFTKGYTNRLLELENIDASKSIISTLNYSASSKSFFVDLVNMQYDCETDVLSEMPDETIVKVRIPSNYWNKDIKVSLYTDDGGLVELTEESYSLEDIYLTVKVPKFNVYATVIIQ